MRNMFALSHPAVVALYLFCAIVSCMLTQHPAYVALSVICALGYLSYLKGPRAALKNLLWLLPFALVVALCNVVFYRGGVTMIGRLFSIPITKESIVGGLSLGGVLISVFLWFQVYQLLMSDEMFYFLFGRLAPGTALMLCMIGKWIPQTLRRGRQCLAVQGLLEGEGTRWHQRLAFRVRAISALFSWSMESGIITADSMRARAYGTGVRTTYAPYRFTRRDGMVMAALLALFACCVVPVLARVNQFTFYPRLSLTVPLWPLLPTALLYCFPMVSNVLERGRMG